MPGTATTTSGTRPPPWPSARSAWNSASTAGWTRASWRPSSLWWASTCAATSPWASCGCPAGPSCRSPPRSAASWSRPWSTWGSPTGPTAPAPGGRSSPRTPPSPWACSPSSAPRGPRACAPSSWPSPSSTTSAPSRSSPSSTRARSTSWPWAAPPWGWRASGSWRAGACGARPPTSSWRSSSGTPCTARASTPPWPASSSPCSCRSTRCAPRTWTGWTRSPGSTASHRTRPPRSCCTRR